MLAQIQNNKVIAIYGEEDDLPDNSHFVNCTDIEGIEVGWGYVDGIFKP